MKDDKLKKRCKFAYALATKSGTSRGAHAPDNFYAREQAKSVDEWIEEVEDEYGEIVESACTGAIEPSGHRL